MSFFILSLYRELLTYRRMCKNIAFYSYHEIIILETFRFKIYFSCYIDFSFTNRMLIINRNRLIYRYYLFGVFFFLYVPNNRYVWVLIEKCRCIDVYRCNWKLFINFMNDIVTGYLRKELAYKDNRSKNRPVFGVWTVKP